MRGNGLSDADLNVLAPYIRGVADRLGLTEWEFKIDDEPVGDEEDAFASINFVFGRRFGTISLCSEFRELTDHRQRYVLIHELLHCHFEVLMQRVRIGLRGLCEDEAAREVVIKLLEAEVEYETDLMAVRIALFFPMIDWGPVVAEAAPAKLPTVMAFQTYGNLTAYTTRSETDEAAAAEADLAEGSAPTEASSGGGDGALDQGTLSDAERC